MTTTNTFMTPPKTQLEQMSLKERNSLILLREYVYKDSFNDQMKTMLRWSNDMPYDYAVWYNHLSPAQREQFTQVVAQKIAKEKQVIANARADEAKARADAAKTMADSVTKYNQATANAINQGNTLRVYTDELLEHSPSFFDDNSMTMLENRLAGTTLDLAIDGFVSHACDVIPLIPKSQQISLTDYYAAMLSKSRWNNCILSYNHCKQKWCHQ